MMFQKKLLAAAVAELLRLLPVACRPHRAGDRAGADPAPPDRTPLSQGATTLIGVYIRVKLLHL